MSFLDVTPSALSPRCWALSDDQQALVSTLARFANKRLEPLLTQPLDTSAWHETRALAADLDLGTMILPVHLGGAAISRHDLALVIEQFAAAPLERAAELTLSSAVLMTLRACERLELLPEREIKSYFDGTRSIALAIPEATSGHWLLRPADANALAPTLALTLRLSAGKPRLMLGRVGMSEHAREARLATLGALLLERGCDETLSRGSHHVVTARDGHHAARTWLLDTSLYLGALLCGAMRHSVDFAFRHCTERRAFRKPIGQHQLVAARLADMLTNTHSAHLFVMALAARDDEPPLTLVRQMVRHVAREALTTCRDLVQLCGAHGYVRGLPPAARFESMHWFAMLLMQMDAALAAFAVIAAAHAPEEKIS